MSVTLKTGSDQRVHTDELVDTARMVRPYEIRISMPVLHLVQALVLTFTQHRLNQGTLFSKSLQRILILEP